MIVENKYSTANGILALLLLVAATAASIAVMVVGGTRNDPMIIATAAALGLVTLIMWCGMFIVQPNNAKALTLFGDYKGTVKEQGLHWANPFLIAKAVSKQVSAYDEQPLMFSIMLACDVLHADRTVYSQGLDLFHTPVPVGPHILWPVKA